MTIVNIEDCESGLPVNLIKTAWKKHMKQAREVAMDTVDEIHRLSGISTADEEEMVPLLGRPAVPCARDPLLAP